MRARILSALLFAVSCGDPADCPPGADLRDWQIIYNWNSIPTLSCSRSLVAELSDYGSVWLSVQEYRHDAGTATMRARVHSDCPTGFRVRMSVDAPAVTVLPVDGIYESSSTVGDPWNVAMGVMSEHACTAYVDSVSVSLTP